MKSVIKNREIRNKFGGVDRILNGENNSYAVVAMCGHCGQGYYIPILFAVHAGNVEEAIDCVKVFPRVKKDSKKCTLGFQEISNWEEQLIRIINEKDRYLTSNADLKFSDRRLIMPEVIEVYNKSKGKQRLNLEKKFFIQTKDEIRDQNVLQRYFAPIKVEKRIDNDTETCDGENFEYIIPDAGRKMDELLIEYYNYKCAYLAKIPQDKLKNDTKKMLCLYYTIMGDPNPLNIRYNPSTGKMSYICGNEIVSFEVKEEVKSKLFVQDEHHKKLREKAIRMYNLNNCEEETITPDIKIKSQVEKFNEKMEKTNQIKQKIREKA